MKLMNPFCLAAMLLFALSTSAQYFSGEFLYKTTIVPKNNTVDVDSIIASQYGELSSYLITDHYYKSTYLKNGKTTYSYTYHADTKRMYDDQADKSYITFRDSRRANYLYEEPVIHRDSTATILGYDTYMVEHPSTFGTTKSYYSDALQVNYETFKEHAVGNWYNKLKTVNGSMSLKSITDHEEYIEIREAVKVTPRVVASSEFDLPANVPVVASSRALDKQPVINNHSEALNTCFLKKAKQAEGIITDPEMNKVYLTAIVGKEGQLSHIKPFEKDSAGLWEVAVDILENCGFAFNPGEIDGVPVAAEIYFPFVFK